MLELSREDVDEAMKDAVERQLRLVGGHASEWLLCCSPFQDERRDLHFRCFPCSCIAQGYLGRFRRLEKQHETYGKLVLLESTNLTFLYFSGVFLHTTRGITATLYNG